MAKFTLQKGDKIIIRPAAPRDENTGQILFIPNNYSKPATVSKVFTHGVRTKEYGYVHNNCIQSKVE